MKRILLLFVLLALGRMAMSKNPVISYDNPNSAAATYMDLSYRYLRPCSDTVVLVARVYNIVKVYNLNGRVMYNRTISQQLQPLDLSGLPKGYYLVELTGDGEKKVLPLILQ